MFLGLTITGVSLFTIQMTQNKIRTLHPGFPIELAKADSDLRCQQKTFILFLLFSETSALKDIDSRSVKVKTGRGES